MVKIRIDISKMAKEPEKRLKAVMDKLFYAPKILKNSPNSNRYPN